jgi:endonuclease-3
MNLAKRVEFFSRLSKENPNPQTELKFRSRFQLLIAVILSAQATDVSVNKATRTLFRVAPTAQKMIELGLAGIKEHIRHIGLFNSKADNILKTCHILKERYKGRVPRTRAELEALPGVGRKTANVVLNTAFGDETIAVDTHIFRVANRTGLARGHTVLAVEKKLLKNVPPGFRADAHHLLILHGRYVCKARAPLCSACVISDLCAHFKRA